MTETCDRCGNPMSEKTISKGNDRGFVKVPDCPACTAALIYLRIPFGAEEKVLAWLERVIDRRIRQAFVERRLP